MLNAAKHLQRASAIKAKRAAYRFPLSFLIVSARYDAHLFDLLCSLLPNDVVDVYNWRLPG